MSDTANLPARPNPGPGPLSLRTIDNPCRPECKLPEGTTVAQAIIHAVSERHLTHRDAANWAGTHPDTLQRWIRRGHEELTRTTLEGNEQPADTEKPYVELTLHLAAAEADSLMACTDAWVGHFGKDFRAVERYVAKRWPDRFGDQPSRVEVSGPSGGPVQVMAAVMTLDEAEARLAEIDARIAAELAEQPALPPVNGNGSNGHGSNGHGNGNGQH